MFCTVGVTLEVVVLVAGGEGQAGGGVGGQAALQAAHGVRRLDVEGVLGVLTTHAEGHGHGLRLVLPVREPDLEEVVAVFGHQVDIFQSQPEFS